LKYKVIITDDVKKGFGATCTYPIIPKFGTCIITARPKYKGDEGLLNHELKHAEQYSKVWFHALKYKFIKSYRYAAEVEAYTEQIKAYKYTTLRQASWIVNALVNKYNLDVSKDKVEADIEAIIKANV